MNKKMNLNFKINLLMTNNFFLILILLIHAEKKTFIERSHGYNSFNNNLEYVFIVHNPHFLINHKHKIH